MYRVSGCGMLLVLSYLCVAGVVLCSALVRVSGCAPAEITVVRALRVLAEPMIVPARRTISSSCPTNTCCATNCRGC